MQGNKNKKQYSIKCIYMETLNKEKGPSEKAINPEQISEVVYWTETWGKWPIWEKLNMQQNTKTIEGSEIGLLLQGALCAKHYSQINKMKPSNRMCKNNEKNK